VLQRILSVSLEYFGLYSNQCDHGMHGMADGHAVMYWLHWLHWDVMHHSLYASDARVGTYLAGWG
jgi:hypothetical protein